MVKFPQVAAEKGGQQVSLPVLASTLTTAIVFFPVTLLYGVSKYLFSALALSVVISLLVSYVVAMTVVPLFCSKFLKAAQGATHKSKEIQKTSIAKRFHAWFNIKFEGMLCFYDIYLARVLRRPRLTLWVFLGGTILTTTLFPLLGVSYFPRTGFRAVCH